MKKLFAPLCSTIIAVVLLFTIITPAWATSGKISGSIVNIRSGPGTNYTVVGTIAQNTSVDILQQKDGWDQIKYGNLTGWVSQSLLTVQETVTVTGTIVNLRSGPGTNYSIAGQVKQGDQLTLLGEQGGWYQIQTSAGLKAYITSSLASKTDNSSSSTASAPASTTGANTIPARVEVISGPINIRSGPATTYTVVGSVDTGIILTVTGEEQDWYKIKKADGSTAYVASWLVKAVTGTATSSTPTTGSTATGGSTTTTAPVTTASAPKVTLNGTELQFDVPPVIKNGNTLVPLRTIFEAMGATVAWDNSTDTAVATKGGTTVVLKIGSSSATINGQTTALEVPAVITNGCTLAPLRFVGEAFGAQVSWDGSKQLIAITTTTTATGSGTGTTGGTTTVTTPAASSTAPKVILNSTELQFDVPPVINNGHTLVPLRNIFEAMGAIVLWDSSTSTVTAKKGDTTVVLKLGAVSALVNNKAVTLDTPAVMTNGRVLVPLRFVGEAFGAQVSWDSSKQLITISTTGTTTTTTTTPTTPTTTTTPTTPTTTTTTTTPTTYVTIKDALTLYSGPATSYNVVGTAQAGERLPVVSTSDNWYQVTRSGQNVWVAGWLVTKDGDSSSTATPAADTISLARSRDNTGLRITIDGSQDLDATPSDDGDGNLVYKFNNMQITGLNYFKETWTNGSAEVKGTNNGDDATVDITIPSGIKYTASTENDGKRDVIFIPNYIISVSSSSLGNNGEQLIVDTMAPVKYTASQSGNQVQVTLSNVLKGNAKSSYSYSYDLLQKAAVQTSSSSTVVTITTSNVGTYKVGQSGNNNTELDIMLVPKGTTTTSTSSSSSTVIVLDAGHGGSETGAIGPGNIDEKDINLAITLKVGTILQQKGYKVIYTRASDTYVSLSDRGEIANDADATIFVCIHCNSSTDSTACGTETYTLTSSDYPVLYAEKDDRTRLAKDIQNQLTAKIERNDRGEKEANFEVLRDTTMPAVLTEVAFISNPAEEGLLETSSFQQLAAEGISNGIVQYLAGN